MTIAEIIDNLALKLAQFECSKLELRFTIGEAMQDVLDSGLYKKLCSAAMKVSEEIERITGHCYGAQFFYHAHLQTHKFTPEDREVFIRHKVPVGYVGWVSQRSSDQRQRIVKAIRQGKNKDFKIPKPVRRKDVEIRHDLEIVQFPVAHPLDLERLVNASASLQSRVDRKVLQDVMNQGAMMAGKPRW